MANRRHLRNFGFALWMAGLALAATSTDARANLQLCNRMSYIVEAALGLEDRGAVATRGWFRINPGQCRTVLQGAIEAQRLFVHAEPLPIYETEPQPELSGANLCVARGDFVIAGARVCSRSDQRLARFTEVRPSEAENGETAYLAEEEDYDDAQARLAGLQRLLLAAGYDASPVDGIEGKKTDAALTHFLKRQNLPPDTVKTDSMFDALLHAAQRTNSAKFAWCNETGYTAMAALGTDSRGTIVTRGWYRIDAGRCLRPDIPGTPKRLFSYAEAIDSGGRVVTHAGQRLTWGGNTLLCTRNVRFELSQHGDCLAMGLTATGFAPVDGAAIVRLAVP